MGTASRSVDTLYRAQLLPKYFASLDRIDGGGICGATEDGIGYLMIPAWSDDLEFDAIEAAMAQACEADVKALIVDVRPNSGGDEGLAGRVAKWFVQGEVVYAKNRYRSGRGKNNFGRVLSRTITGNGDGKRLTMPTAVLMSRGVMSSCEAFVLMMKQAPQCTLVGQRSYGSSANPKPHELSNGVTLVVPSWQAMLPDGTCFEGAGIAPDVQVEVDPAELATRDPILERALEILRAKQ